MKDLAEYIIKQLVNNPDAVSIEETTEGGEVNLLVTVDPSDMGIVIGKSGQTIKAIRRLLSVRAITDNVRVNLRLVEPEGHESKEETERQSEEEEKIGESKDENQEEVKKTVEVETSEASEPVKSEEE